jgi:glycosyltransferase involved in cell wall biosynthesis
MFITQVVPSITEEASGPSYSVSRLSNAVGTQEIPSQIIALDWIPGRPPPPGVTIFPLGFGPKRLGRSPAMHRWLDEAAREGELAVLHSHSLFMYQSVYPGRVARRRGVPYIASPRGTLSAWSLSHGHWSKSRFWKYIQRPALACADVFHATGDAEYEEIRAVGFRQPVAIIPNGIDVPPVLPVLPPRPRRTILFLSRLHPKKGVDLLLDAWHAVWRAHPEWDLAIIGPGEGDYPQRLGAQAQRLGLRNVRFTGAIYGEAKLAQFAGADVFILPTHSENFGMAVAEALAAGTPAIVTTGAPWSGLHTKRAGWWINHGLDALVSALETAMASTPEDLRAMGMRGREWMLQDFSWVSIGHKMRTVYAWMRDGGAPPPEVRMT